MAQVIQRIATVVGGLLMVVGVFMPMLSIPVLRDDSYFQLSPGGAIILLVLGGLSVLIAVWGRFKLLYVTGLVALGLLVYTYFQVDRRKSSAQSDVREHVINTPLKGLSQKLVSSVGLRYGWPVMMLGAAMTVAVPLVGSRLSRKEKRTET